MSSETRYVPCPRCWHQAGPTDTRCASCGYAIPTDYHQACLEAPPIPIATFGFTGAAKTHLLAAVLLHLTQLSDHIAGAAPFAPVGEVTTIAVRDFFQKATSGQDLEPTKPRLDRIDKDIWIVTGSFPGMQPRTLIFYDIAGELCIGSGDLAAELPALEYVSTLWFCLAPSQILQLRLLFDSYKRAMTVRDQTLRGKHAIFVMNKADQWNATNPDINEYRSRDNLAAYDDSGQRQRPAQEFHLEKYEREMAQLRQAIKTEIQTLDGGSTLITLVQNANMCVSFTLAAPRGCQGAQDPLAEQEPWKRTRVLDPLISTFAARQMESPAVVLLDVHDAETAQLGLVVATALWRSLRDKYPVEIWTYDGQHISTEWIRPPAEVSPNARPCLIRPLLDMRRPPITVVVADRVPLDLTDEDANAIASPRVVFVPLVIAGRTVATSWPHCTKAVGAADVAEAVRSIRALLG